MGRNKKVSDRIRKVSGGLLSTATDMALVSLYFGFEFSTAGTRANQWQAGDKAHKHLEEFSSKTIKRSLSHLKQKGLIEVVGDELQLHKVTKMGKRRLKYKVPAYQENRPWNGRLYLITYDIPRERNKDRNMLRKYMRKIGCGMLQHSVWLTPYSPKKLINEFVNNRGLKDLILVSTLRKKDSIGDMQINEIVERVYNLSELNERYDGFVKETKPERVNRRHLMFSYLSILSDDPQLPFELLPEDWLGGRAYELFCKIA